MVAPLHLRWAAIATIAAWVYPLLMVACLYGAWLVAWATLGHPPQTPIDDPASISVWVSTLCVMAGLLLVGFPLAAYGGIVSTAWLASLGRTPIVITVLLIAGLISLWIAVFMFIRWDPYGVSEWYID